MEDLFNLEIEKTLEIMCTPFTFLEEKTGIYWWLFIVVPFIIFLLYKGFKMEQKLLQYYTHSMNIARTDMAWEMWRKGDGKWRSFIAQHGYAYITNIAIRHLINFEPEKVQEPFCDYLLFMKNFGVYITSFNFVGRLHFDEETEMFHATNPNGSEYRLLDNLKRPFEYVPYLSDYLSTECGIYLKNEEKDVPVKERTPVESIQIFYFMNDEAGGFHYDGSFEKFKKKYPEKQNCYIAHNEIEMRNIISNVYNERGDQKFSTDIDEIIKMLNRYANGIIDRS